MSAKRIILITGANSGIGFCAAKLLSSSGENHVLLGSRSAEKGQVALDAIKADQPSASLSLLQLDVTSDDSVAAAVKTVERDYGRLDVLINNAGIAEKNRLSEERKITSREDFDHILNTNVTSVYVLTCAMEALLKKGRDPLVLNVTSMLGSVAQRADHDSSAATVAYHAYRASKAALNMIAMQLRWDFRDWARVCVLCPGFVVSNLSGPEDIEYRKQNGAGDPMDSARAMERIVRGERDAEMGSLMEARGSTSPW
ncbi:uncharacterized protein F5Z01DRAFT_267800 [Emericellopsis atlantica]|uniref:Short chain dehydrogenase n=1 Tax=Emericellopsis atlantica TaxID=2614577 RepID=A0A9P7ZGD3_9HYPO|nr:uncharacterized protein F5Z01DRAFT_267800 [Emericellopsis atlantica]KAG9251500.1 hypothetical protein F5Z01DRAFT_267800 [Emericellopsis atlantica]